METCQAELAVIRAAHLVTPIDAGTLRCRPEFRSILDGAVVVRRGRIVAVGTTREILAAWKPRARIDATGCLVTPGFVDAHTHLVFAGSRADEFEMRIRGDSYREIAQAGGGIPSTVRATRDASEAELLRWARERRRAALTHGSTTVEVKSGYGLDEASETKLLRVIGKLEGVVPTFLGAHAKPDKRWISRVLRMMPRVRARFCDVFCEPGFFSLRESETILRAAKQAGLAVKIHADEFERSGGAMLAAKVGATSADHLLAATNDDFRAMAAAGVVAVLLPTTSLSIGRFARARRMIEMGVTLALGSDWNPGTSMTGNMQLVAHLACELLKLTPDEALAAATLNAAYACGEAARTGSLEPGKRADLVVWSASNVAELMHGFGFNPARLVIRAGRLVYDSSAVKG